MACTCARHSTVHPPRSNLLVHACALGTAARCWVLTVGKRGPCAWAVRTQCALAAHARSMCSTCTNFVKSLAESRCRKEPPDIHATAGRGLGGCRGFDGSGGGPQGLASHAGTHGTHAPGNRLGNPGLSRRLPGACVGVCVFHCGMASGGGRCRCMLDACVFWACVGFRIRGAHACLRV